VQILRAHRLWETYLAREARVPIGRVHGPAEQAEHRLTAFELDALEAALGHPRSDPHGDPIPTAAGDIAPLGAQPLTRWPVGEPAQIVHLEDEPESLFSQIPSALRPGVRIQTVATNAGQLTVSDGSREYPLSPLVAGNIQVAAVATPAAIERWTNLSDLQMGEEGEVIALGAELQGFTRRRLLDLGLTPQARVGVYLDNAFGDPRAYRVRGTTIALRNDQASHIQVRKL
jgi:DtxR family Mn-dependent transcriptional regulator